MPVINLAKSLRIKKLNIRFPFIVIRPKKGKRGKGFITKPGRIIFK